MLYLNEIYSFFFFLAVTAGQGHVRFHHFLSLPDVMFLGM